MEKDFISGSDTRQDTRSEVNSDNKFDFGGDLARDEGVDLNVDDVKGRVAKAMSYEALPPTDYNFSADLPPVSAMYCDAPANVGRSLEEEFPDLNITYKPDETMESRLSSPQDVTNEMYNNFQDTGIDLERDQEQNRENEEQNSISNKPESADNCDPPHFDDDLNSVDSTENTDYITNGSDNTNVESGENFISNDIIGDSKPPVETEQSQHVAEQPIEVSPSTEMSPPADVVPSAEAGIPMDGGFDAGLFMM